MAVFREEAEEVAAVEALNEDQPQSFKALLLTTLRILIPTDVSNLLWMSSQTVTLIFVSRAHGALGTAQYTAGLTIFNMSAFSFVQGFGAAIDTISSQAYGKNRKSPVVGETLQLALAFNLVLWVLCSLFFLFCEGPVCFVMGKDIGMGTAHFLKWCPPYLLVQIISGVMSKSMFAQKVPGIVAVANFAAACTSPIANYFLTHLGLHGAALSLFVTVALCSITHILCCFFHPRVIVREAQWPTPLLRSLPAWRRFFKIGFPSVVATCSEWWAFEVQVVLAAQLGELPLAIHGVCMSLVSQLFSVALGICVAASVIVGNALGANRPVQARQFAYFILIVDVVLAAVMAFFMLLFGSHIAQFFTTKESADYDSIVNGVRDMMPYVVLCHVGDSLQFCLQGIYRGAGKPKEAGIAVLATLWVVGVPASCIFVLVVHTGVKGCIGGLLIGFVFEIPVLFVWMTRFNWEKLALKAQERPEEPAEMVTIEGDTASPASDSSSEADHKKNTSLFDNRSGHNEEWREGIVEYPNVLCDEPLSPLMIVSAERPCE